MTMFMRLALFTLVLAVPAAVFAQGSQQPSLTVPRPSSQPGPDQASSDVASAPAEVSPPRRSRFGIAYRPGLAARINPLGLFVGGPIMLRMRLYDSDSAALKDNFVALGAIVLLSPALIRAGVGFEVQPLTILNLGLSYEVYQFFGNFDYLQSYQTPTAETADADMKALSAAGLSYKGTGGVLTFSVLFQIKFGPIAVRSNFRLFYYSMKLRAGDKVFYDPLLDIMSPGNGVSLTNDLDVLYVTKVGFAGGLRYTTSHSIFAASDYAPGEAQVNPNGIHRLGPFLAYTFFDDEQKHRYFNAPTLVLIAQWHLQHRYRRGQAVSAALPWIALAFQFKGII